MVVEDNNPVYDSRNGCNAIIETSSNTLISGTVTSIIPESVKSIGNSAFLCISLSSITIPNGVMRIGEGAFNGCSSLTSVTIPESVISIRDYAFGGSGLTSVTIPSSVTEIGENPFNYCTSLQQIIVNPNNHVYDSREECNAIIKTSSNTLIIGCQNTTISNSVANIGSFAFWGCSDLTSITIPESVTSIGDYSFDDCSGLTSVVTEMETPFAFGSDAFENIGSSCVLTVPYGTRDAYIAAGWTEDVFKGGVVEAPAPVVLATSVAINEETLSLTTVGETATLTATVLPENVTDSTVTWTSSDESVATVSSEGVVTAVANGTAIITATTNDGSNLSATCTVTNEIIPMSEWTKENTFNYNIQLVKANQNDHEYTETCQVDLEQVRSAVGEGKIKLYTRKDDSDSPYTRGYTCTPYPGFWMDEQGEYPVEYSSTTSYGMTFNETSGVITFYSKWYIDMVGTNTPQVSTW